MKRLRYFFVGISAIILVGAIFTSEGVVSDLLKAETATFTLPTFSLYDKVKITNKEYTVVDNGEVLKLLSDTEAETNQLHGNAAFVLSTYNTGLGIIGKTVFQDKHSLPNKDSLSFVSTGDILNASIPKVSNRWWLSDTPETNKASFVSAENTLNEEVISKKTNISEENACGEENISEYGQLPSDNFQDEDVLGKPIMTGGTTYFTIKNLKSNGVTLDTITPWMNFYGGSNCEEETRGLRAAGAQGAWGSAVSWNTAYDNGISFGSYYYVAILWLHANIPFDKRFEIGETVEMNVNVDQCYTNNREYVTSYGTFNSHKFTASGPVITLTADEHFVEPGIEKKTCPGQTHEAGLASIRPMLQIAKSDIISATSGKRTYNKNASLTNAFPSITSNPTNLTIKTNTLNATLESGASGVSGSTFTTTIENGKVSLPIMIANLKEGKSYVSAKGMDTSGNVVYGILDEMSGTNTNIELDVSNLKRNDDGSITITLYQEDSGAYDTAYMSEGNDITIEILELQDIVFDASQATSTTYGADITITSSLLSALDKQSTEDVTYSIITGSGETAKAEIISQSYDNATGKATATIHPLIGTGSFILAINKAGDANTTSASQKTMNIELNKKSITISPTIPTRVYHVGDSAFTPSSTSLDLAQGDVIPSTLKPGLVGIDESTPASPFSSGKVSEAGTWKLVYPSGVLVTLTAFTDKYNVTLKEYSVSTPEYIFESILSDVPSDWIVISPDANADGWNKTDVVIEPSASAIAKGYTKIDLLSDEDIVIDSGGKITLSSETNSIIPYVRLKKGSVNTGIKTLRAVKIDKTLPLGTITIENELVWANNKKTVTISSSDALSGVSNVTVSNEGNSVTVVKKADGIYTFDATKDGEYETKICDVAGNERTTTIEVSKIAEPSLVLEAVAQTQPNPPLSQDIQLTYDAGISGIKSFKVYFLLDGDYKELEDISDTGSPKLYKAGMNGTFKFVLENNAGEKKEVVVSIAGLKSSLPVTSIEAVLEDDTTKSYTSGTWTNQNVVLKLRNVNTELSADIAITWAFSDDEGNTWQSMGSDTSKTVSTTEWVKKKLLFRATATATGGISANEATPVSMNVNIDKTTPVIPTVKNSGSYGEDKWFGQTVKVETEALVERPSKISQQVYVRIGESGTWNVASAGSISVSGNGKHEVFFKVVDAAGNESAKTNTVFVNISDEQPEIVIKLNNDPIKTLINNLTFGYFFKDTVNVNIEAIYPSGTSAKISYVVDDSSESQMPENRDARWIEGSSTSIEPDKRVMIYAKAVSASGIIAKESSLHDVVVDQTKPTIKMPSDTSAWTNSTTLDVEVSDDTAGLDMSKVNYCVGSDACVPLLLSNGKATISDLEEGTYEISVQATDYSGNAHNDKVNVKIDSTVPVITAPSATPGTLSMAQRIDFNVSDALSGIANDPVVKTSAGVVVNVVKTDNGYTFNVTKNGIYVITVKDNAGNETTLNYEEHNVSDEGVSELEVFASVKGAQITSGTWVNDDITFTISNGLPSGILEKYQFASTDGTTPSESDWQDISDSANRRHIVSAEQKGKSYYFRALPVLPEAVISSAFVVNLDMTIPVDVSINLTKKNTNIIARMVNKFSFGNWLKEAQEVRFTASDNYSTTAELTYYYAEEVNGVVGKWKKDSSALSYEDTDIILHAKAVDLAGNESIVVKEDLKIDKVAPVIIGVKDQGEYKHYYLPRFISADDEGSGIKIASYTTDGSEAPIVDEVKVMGIGTYEVNAEDHAGNTVALTFKIVPLPILDDIDGTDESKDIIDQVKKELDEIKDKIDETEKKDYEDWVQDANDKWDELRKKVIEDEDKTSKVEGVGDTNFDPKVELIVEPIEADTLPELPRKALYNYNVYLRKGTTVVQPNGDVKVFLPYPEEAEPVVYEIDEGTSVSELPSTVEGEHVVFTTSVLEKYAISNVDQKETNTDMKVPGPDGEMDTKDDVIAKPGPDKEPERRPDGGINVPDDGSVVYPDGTEIPTPDGGILYPDGSLELPNGDKFNPDGSKVPSDEDVSVPGPDGDLDTDDDVIAKPNPDGDKPKPNPDGSVSVPPGGSVEYPNGDVVQTPEGGTLNPDGSLTLPDGTEYDKDGNKKPKVCNIKDGVVLNIDTDNDGKPDLNLDINNDCKAELNIDLTGDLIPDINIDTTGDGKADINIDVNEDGEPDTNLLKLSKWVPDKDCTFQDFAYDTMSGLYSDDNLSNDSNNPNNPNNPSKGSGGANDSIVGALTGDNSKWTMWWIILLTTITTMGYQIYRKKKRKSKI